jgi:hypothetical protein
MNLPATETALQKERRLFREIVARLRDSLLNRMFDLRPEKAARRSSYLFVLFILSGLLVSFFYYRPSEWAGHIGNLLNSLLGAESTPAQFEAAVNGFLAFLWKIFLDARILQYLPVFLAPFFIALQTAAMYLADVFELDDVSVARQFISSVALSGSNEVIRIKHGEIAEESRESPAFLIGGPGRVVVELDSVALFERADGTPHVIGPTGKEPGGKATLEGFERLRQALDVRDHFVELRDQDESSEAVKSRSRDGIPVKATDVRLMFSVYRGDNREVSAENPYPFSREAVEQIVYKAASRVTPHLPSPSTFEFSWINNMVGLIRDRLGGFMSKHNLTEYMASIGIPEVEKVKQREEIIHRQMQELTQSGDEAPEQKEIKVPAFQPRYKVRSLFAQFADEFTGKARSNGVELHWIGVGTWESAVKIVPEKHLEAWLLTQENLKNDSPEEMSKIEQREVVEKIKELIEKVPLNAFEEILAAAKQGKKAGKQSPKKKEKPRTEFVEGDDNVFAAEEMKQFVEMLDILQTMRGEKEEWVEPRDSDHAHDVQALLLEYRKQFQETADFIKDKNEPVPPNILDAIRYIDNQIAHWAGLS